MRSLGRGLLRSDRKQKGRSEDRPPDLPHSAVLLLQLELGADRGAVGGEHRHLVEPSDVVPARVGAVASRGSANGSRAGSPPPLQVHQQLGQPLGVGPGVEPADQRGAIGVAASDRVERLAGPDGEQSAANLDAARQCRTGPDDPTQSERGSPVCCPGADAIAGLSVRRRLRGGGGDDRLLGHRSSGLLRSLRVGDRQSCAPIEGKPTRALMQERGGI